MVSIGRFRSRLIHQGPVFALVRRNLSPGSFCGPAANQTWTWSPRGTLNTSLTGADTTFAFDAFETANPGHGTRLHRQLHLRPRCSVGARMPSNTEGPTHPNSPRSGWLGSWVWLA